MDVYDSNIWISGFTDGSQNAKQLIKEVRQANREVVVDAYIYDEVFEDLGNLIRDRQLIKSEMPLLNSFLTKTQ